MSDWQNYGFTQNDLALGSIDLSLNAFVLALKERFELLGLINNAAYQYINNYVNKNYVLLANQLAITSSSGADYSTNWFCLVDYLLTVLMPSRNTGLFNISHSYYLTKDNYDYIDTSVLRYDLVIDKAVGILLNDGFNTTRISITTTFQHNQPIALSSSRQNKHWAIQRQKTINLLRYALNYHGSSGYNIVGVYHQSTNHNYMSFDDSLNYLTYERAYYVENGVEYGGHYAPIINLYYKNGQFYIYRLFDYFLIKKSFIESISFIKDKIYSRLQVLLNNDTYSTLTVPFWWSIDFNNIVSYTYDGNTDDYYVINCPFSRNDIINIAKNYIGYIDDGNEHNYEIILRFNNNFYELLDGVNYFSFLDIS